MKIILEGIQRLQSKAYKSVCPYNGFNTCRASLSSMMIDKRQQEDYCTDENYDTCPIFLAKMLRMVSKDSTSRREAHYEF
jgi:hypothetical protein